MFPKRNELQTRSKHEKDIDDEFKFDTREKFFQIWSHKAVNISNDLIEYTIRLMQSDRLRLLLQTRNELTQRANHPRICNLSAHIEDDLKRINELIRRFCLSTRIVYRHLRSDARLYPKMAIELDENIIVKICRFIFKTKLLIKILSKRQHLNPKQRQQAKESKSNSDDRIISYSDPYRNIAKAFIALQSNFEILFGDTSDKDFFKNAKTAVQTLPIILDTCKIIQLIFCSIYKLTESERMAEAEATRQHRRDFYTYKCGRNQLKPISKNIQDYFSFQTENKPIRREQSSLMHTQSPSSKMESNDRSTDQQNITTIRNIRTAESPKSQSTILNPTISKSDKIKQTPMSSPSSSFKVKTNNIKLKNKLNKKELQPTKKNKNKSAMVSSSLTSHNDNTNLTENHNIKKFKQSVCNVTPTMSMNKRDWTTWLHNSKLNRVAISPSKQSHATKMDIRLDKSLLTTWASFDRKSKV